MSSQLHPSFAPFPSFGFPFDIARMSRRAGWDVLRGRMDDERGVK